MSDELKTSPGEWSVGRRGFADWGMPTTIPVMAGEKVVCKVPSICPPAVGPFHNPKNQQLLEESKADAYMLAASKDLYEALELQSDPMILAHAHEQGVKKCPCYDCTLKMTKAALAKARGEVQKENDNNG